MNRAICSFAFLLSLSPVAISAEDTAHSSVPYVRATGESTVEVKPDQAIVNIGVVTQAPTASAAATQNATQVTAVLAKLKTELGGKGEIRSIGYSVNPNFSYPNPPSSGGPKIVGYTASNTVRVKLDDINLVGKVVDAATSSGANNVNGIQFSVKDEQGVRARAIQEASVKARAAGEAMASALGVRVIKVRSAEAGQPSLVRPMMGADRMAMAAMKSAPTPVEPGNVEVSATVTVTLEVAP